MKLITVLSAALLTLGIVAQSAPVFAQKSAEQMAAEKDWNAAAANRAALRAEVKRQAEMAAAAKRARDAENQRHMREAAANTDRNVAASRRRLLTSQIKREAKAEAKRMAAEKAKKAAMMKAEEMKKARAAAIAAAKARQKEQARAAAEKAAQKAAMMAAEAKKKEAALMAQEMAKRAAACQSKFSQVSANSKIKFATGSANLGTRDTSALDALVAIAKSCPGANIAVEGHTDATGSEASNLSLSQRRAAAVKDYLAKAGIGNNRLSSVGYGEAKPIASNDSKAGRAKNRRIELIVK